MAHCVFHPSGLKASEFSAVLNCVMRHGRKWRRYATSDPELLPLLVRIGEAGLGQITMNGLAKQLERQADISSAFTKD